MSEHGRPATGVPAVLVAASFALVAGLVLWPPGAVYWTPLASVVGDGPTVALVGLLAVGLGAAFGRLTDVETGSLLVGTVVAYVAGMVVLETTFVPDSPIHLIWYGVLAGCLVVGAAVGRRVDA